MINVKFVSMDKSEVCPDPAMPAAKQQPRPSAETRERKRFKPEPAENALSLAGSILELITDPDTKTLIDVQDRCFRLNGELVTVPQTEEEEKLVDNVAWDYQMKKASNNMTHLVEVQ